jgi:hypothetical protein
MLSLKMCRVRARSVTRDSCLERQDDEDSNQPRKTRFERSLPVLHESRREAISASAGIGQQHLTCRAMVPSS